MLELGVLRGLITVATLLTFVGICWWAYRSGTRSRFEADGWLPFADEMPLPAASEDDGRASASAGAANRREGERLA